MGGTLDGLATRLRSGDDRAAAEVVRRFSRRLIDLARVRLGGIRRKVDPEDVLQSVYRSFFVRHRDGRLECDSWDSAWAILTVMTIRKCSSLHEHFLAARRDVRREVGRPSGRSSSTGWEALGREPRPEEAAVFTDLLEKWMRAFDHRERSILALRLQGCTVPEISLEVGRAERTIRRVIARARLRLHRMEAGGETA